jgi:hypothetical protein
VATEKFEVTYWTPLMIASVSGEHKAIDLLYEFEYVECDDVDKAEQRFCLFAAATAGHVDTVAALLRWQSIPIEEALVCACIAGNEPVVRAFLVGRSVSTLSKCAAISRALLIIASQHSHESLVDFLSDIGDEPSAAVSVGQTALQWAAAPDIVRVFIVQQLLSKRSLVGIAKSDAHYNEATTPAIQRGHEAVESLWRECMVKLCEECPDMRLLSACLGESFEGKDKRRTDLLLCKAQTERGSVPKEPSSLELPQPYQQPTTRGGLGRSNSQRRAR